MIGRAAALADAFCECAAAEKLAKAKIRRFACSLKGTELLCRLLCGAGESGKESEISCVSKAEGIRGSAPVPLISGKHGIELGAAPGVGLGKIVKRCFEAQLDGAFSDLEGGKEYLVRLLENEKKAFL